MAGGARPAPLDTPAAVAVRHVSAPADRTGPGQATGHRSPADRLGRGQRSPTGRWPRSEVACSSDHRSDMCRVPLSKATERLPAPEVNMTGDCDLW